MELVVVERSGSLENGRRIDAVAGSLPLDQARLSAAKRAFVTRRVDIEKAELLLVSGHTPRRGDLVLARVDRLGQHTGVQRIDGRRAKIYRDDEIVVAYGARYAPNQFESVLPQDLGPCHLVAAGGMASLAVSKHRRIRRATEITPVGVLADASGRALNLHDFSLPASSAIPAAAIPALAFVGTSMDAGKTTAAADTIRGLHRAGLRVGAAKITGTGACGDFYFYVDAGADVVVDFSDFGYGSTCGADADELTALLKNIVGYLQRQHVDVMVLEVADGLLQRETDMLLRSPAYAEFVSSTVFCAPDALGAAGGVDWLEHQGLHVSAVAGSMTAAPLSAREANMITRLPVLTRADLADPAQAMVLLSSLRDTASINGGS